MEIINSRLYVNNKEQSPCICSKAKYVLGLKSKKPINKKTCTYEYWQVVVKALGKINKVPKTKIEKALNSRIYLS